MNIDYYKKYFVTDNKSGYKTRENHVKKNFPDLYDKIIKYDLNDENMVFNQKLYNYLYSIIEIPKCLTCGKEIKWRGVFTEGYKEYCNLQCGGKGIKRINNIKNTVSEKYGVDYISQLDKTKEKIIKNNNEKYGVDHMFQSEEIKEKSKKTNLKLYGTEHAISSDLIKSRRKLNNIKKYGVDSPSKLDSVKEILKNTVNEKYGVDSVMQVDSIKSKLLDKKLKSLLDKLSINYKIENVSDSQYLIVDQCEKHSEYIIDKNLFYHRVLIYKIDNPCVHCNPISKTSSIKENEIKDYIKNNLKISIDENNREVLNGKEIDIYLPEHKLGIEFNGLYWHSNLNVDKDYHLNKTELASVKGVQLLHIFEDEWIFKTDIVKSIINNKLNINSNKIYGRKCLMKEVDSKTSKKFLDDNHIQGSINSSIRLGLFYENELVSLMTFGKLRKAMGSKSEDGEYEMYRFCNKLNTTIMGGASKLFKSFLKKYNPKKIISYADRRYFDGNLYKNLNFIFASSTKPNFWYFKKNTLTREYRYNYRKDVLVKKGFDKTKTALEIMSDREYLRIYDCGNLKFEYIT